MSPTSRPSAMPWRKTTLLLLTLLPPISMIGCSARYVVVDGEQTITVKKSAIDNLYSDNERLLKALEECRGAR